jgi:hypothetical protein
MGQKDRPDLARVTGTGQVWLANAANAPFSQLVLCLSRACLGKSIVSKLYKWLKKDRSASAVLVSFWKKLEKVYQDRLGTNQQTT